MPFASAGPGSRDDSQPKTKQNPTAAVIKCVPEPSGPNSNLPYGSYSLRDEPWVRLRVAERLSVALLEGETDWLRAETEREYLPVMNAYQVRAKLITYPGGHTIARPPSR